MDLQRLNKENVPRVGRMEVPLDLDVFLLTSEMPMLMSRLQRKSAAIWEQVDALLRSTVRNSSTSYRICSVRSRTTTGSRDTSTGGSASTTRRQKENTSGHPVQRLTSLLGMLNMTSRIPIQATSTIAWRCSQLSSLAFSG